jgi:sec-independent protein translocase protein TatA
MLENIFSGWHIIIVLLVVVLLFGATRLPALARAVGQSARIFRTEVRSTADESSDAPADLVDGSDSRV